MAEHNHAWHSKDTAGGIAYGTPSLTNMIKENQERDQVIAGLATNVNVLTKMFTESQTKKVNVVEDVQPMSNEDYEEANYVNNSQGGYQRQPYQGSGQQNQWRPNPQGQGNQQCGKNLRGENEQVVEVEDSEQEVEAQVEVPIVVEVERLPKKVRTQEVNPEEVKEKVIEAPKTLAPIPRPPLPFPQRHARKVDNSKLEKFYDILKQLSNKVVNVTHRVSSIIATTTAPKKEDPGAFTIPNTIGLRDFARALCNNGASINLMPLAIYKQAGLGMPRPTSMRLEMADRPIKRPVGIVDDVLVKVGEFLLPADFVILDCAWI
ncbi:PREDICTED: uncharacterized protein LOC109233581 [Nicotiana attenuata]|uniref:uncharacterized protein LOC109233581 n=1 Tax=Nicotiana attenuata TaxID=49451 RepID=UPI000905073E|nr:PREDICTED: uncharacterized protein LOC109233581 [Nicotiana attenuata]